MTGVLNATIRGEVPSDFELLAPPIILLILIIIIVLMLSCITQHLWWRARFCPKTIVSNPSALDRIKSIHPPTAKNDIGLKTQEDPADFLSVGNRNVIRDFMQYQNSPKYTLKITLPALFSLAFCPAALYFRPVIIKNVWNGIFPDINDMVAGFLTPSGLIYAIAFGFAYQQAVNKMEATSAMLHEIHGTISQIMELALVVPKLQVREKLQILRYLKDELLCEFRFLNKSGGHSCKGECGWKVIHSLVKADVSESGQLDDLLLKEMTTQWVFLEMLGIFTFLGILLMNGGSYRIELASCLLTVFSISFFCYVLADMDEPFHGFLRVDLGIFVTLITELETRYHQVSSRHPAASHVQVAESSLDMIQVA